MLGFRNVEDNTYNDIREKSLMQWLDDMEKHEDVAVRGGVKLAKEYFCYLKEENKRLKAESSLKSEYLKKVAEKKNNEKIYNNKHYKNNIFRLICSIFLIILTAAVMTGMTGCGNNKNVASGSNTAMIHNSQPADNNTKAETQSASETKADMDTQAFQETDTNSTEEAKASDDSEYTTDEQVSDDSDNKDRSDSEDNDEWNDLDEGANEDSDEAAGDTVDNRITICIDPGHGGSNEGTKENYDGTLIKEKNITMTIARKLKYYLEQNDNIRVVMTRNSDTAVSLAGRIEYAAANNADYVISMHINSKSTDELDAHGCMVLMSCSRYQPANARFTSIYDRERSLAYSILAKLNGIGIPIANDSWNGNEYKDGILQRLNTVNELYPDGSMADYYGLINEGTCAGIPTIIVEHAFLSNVNDYRNYLSTDAQLDALARADAAGILEVVLQ